MCELTCVHVPRSVGLEEACVARRATVHGGKYWLPNTISLLMANH